MSVDPYTDLDTFHTEWLFACPHDKKRFVVVLKNKDGMVTGRRMIEASDSVTDAHLVYAVRGPDSLSEEE